MSIIQKSYGNSSVALLLCKGRNEDMSISYDEFITQCKKLAIGYLKDNGVGIEPNDLVVVTYSHSFQNHTAVLEIAEDTKYLFSFMYYADTDDIYFHAYEETFNDCVMI